MTVFYTLQVFDLHYADGSHLRGFNGVDQVWVSADSRGSQEWLNEVQLCLPHTLPTWACPSVGIEHPKTDRDGDAHRRWEKWQLFTWVGEGDSVLS